MIRCLDCGRAEEFTLQKKKAAAIPRFLNNLHYSPPTIVVIDPIPRECSQLRRVAFGRFFSWSTCVGSGRHSSLWSLIDGGGRGHKSSNSGSGSLLFLHIFAYCGVCLVPVGLVCYEFTMGGFHFVWWPKILLWYFRNILIEVFTPDLWPRKTHRNETFSLFFGHLIAHSGATTRYGVKDTHESTEWCFCPLLDHTQLVFFSMWILDKQIGMRHKNETTKTRNAERKFCLEHGWFYFDF